MPGIRKQAPKKKTARPRKPSELSQLRAKLARLETKYTKLVIEKGFLERAVEDLNFHNNVHDGIVYTDVQDRIIYANPYFLGMMGVKEKGELVNKPFPNYMWKNEHEAERLFTDIRKDGFVREREMSLSNKEGQPVFAMCSAVANKDEDGNIVGTELMFCNITGKRTFQAELVEQHALLDAMLQSTPDPILILTSALDINRLNPVAGTLFGLKTYKARQPLAAVLTKAGLPAEVVRKLESLLAGEQALRTGNDLAWGAF
ncbi:MAG: PAS domain-containing protein [Anaerolineales bacterium]